MGSLKFNHENVDWISFLRNSYQLGGLPYDFLIHLMNSHNGYISGSFARKVSEFVLGKNGINLISNKRKFYPFRKDDHALELRRLLRIDNDVNEHQYNNIKFYKGDIDVFFKHNDLNNLHHELLEKFYFKHSADTPAMFGKEYYLDNTLVQCITKINGEPEDVLSTFDITNAQVYLDLNGIHFTDEWVNLEEQSLLGIEINSKPNIVWRTKKWYGKHYYNNLRKGDHEKYVDALFMTAEKFKNKESYGFIKTINDLNKFVKTDYLFSAPITLILKASLLLDSYNQMNILKNLDSIVKTSEINN